MRVLSEYIIINTTTNRLMRQKKELSTPIALLVLYDTGHRFKFKKYYLRQGKNKIGSDIDNQILIQGTPANAANLLIRQDLASIQPLAENSVHVPSNMNKKNSLMVQLNKGWRYVIEMEKDFFICKKKALMQVLSLKQLLQVRGVENQAMFIRQSNVNSSLPSHIEEFEATVPIQDQHAFSATIPLDEHCFNATIPLNDNAFEHTIPLQDNNFDATLLLDDNQARFEATIQMDEPVIPLDNAPSTYNRENENNLGLLNTQSRGVIRSSQFAYMNSLSNQSANLTLNKSNEHQDMAPQAEQRQVSMPDTLQENQMPDTLQENEMPATLQQDDSEQASSGKKMSQSVPTKSKTKVFDPISKNFYSLDEKPKQINDFDDLFANEGHLEKKPPFSHSVSAPENHKSIQHSNSHSSATQKIQEPSQQNKSHSLIRSHDKSLKKAGVLGCKRADISLKALKEKGYTLVDHPDEDFDLLLVGVNGLKLCKRIMLALIENKEIRSINWIKDPNAKISGKIEGFPWQMIQKSKAKNPHIFTGKYYLQQQLREQFHDVMTKAGAEMQDKLSKGKNRTAISIIIDEKSQHGISLYKQYRSYKRWKFYKKKMLVESIFIAEEIKEKYEIEDYQV